MSKGDVAFIIFIGVAVVALLLGLGLPSLRTSQPHPQPNMAPASNGIVHENAQLGTSSWQIPAGREATIEIQAYVGATSVLPGESLNF